MNQCDTTWGVFSRGKQNSGRYGSCDSSQPSQARVSPVSISGCFGDAEQFGGLDRLQAGKITEVGQFAGQRVHGSQPLQALVQVQQLVGGIGSRYVESFEI